MGWPALTQFPPSTAVVGEGIGISLCSGPWPVTSPACPFHGGRPSEKVRLDGSVLEGNSGGEVEGL